MIYLKDGNIPLNLAYDDDIVQEANSTYQLSFKFPLTDGKWNLLKREVFLLADDLHGEQEFFIFEVKKVNSHVQVYAKQVATLLNYYSINSISVDRVPGQTVMTALAGSVKRPCPFTFFSDILDRHTFNESNVSVMDALAKDKHSVIGQWGGDLVRDKYQVKLLKNGGTENESLFMYKKNLSSYEESENINNLKTRLHLKKIIQGQSEGEEDRVIVVTVDSPLISQYSQIYEADIEVNDQDVTDEASLLAYGQRYFGSTLCDLVENSINLDVKGKSDVSVKMFDTVSVFHERFDVDLRLKITSYHFGPMSKRLKSIGFGKVSQSFGSTVASMVAGSIDKATGRLSASFEQKLQKEIDNANRHFDAEFEKRVEEINDGIEQAQAEAERYADAIKQEIDTEIAQVNQSMQAQSEEHDRQVADILAKTQSVESLANQAKTDAASAITQALQSKNEAIADARAQVSTVSQALNTAKTDLQNQVNAVDAKAVKVQSDANALRTDLNQQAQTLLSQAQAQTALTNRVASVETLADGTRSTVTELSKTVNKATGDIASVTSRTKTVEDTLGQTRTQYEALTQTVNAQTGQIDSINRKTADLQSGIDGMTERFENLRVGARNYAEDYDFSRGLWEYSQGDSSDTDRSTDNGIYTLTTTTNTWHQLQIHSESGGRLGGKKDSTALLELEVGETYTLSVEVKANSGSPKFWLELRDNGLSNYNGVVTHLGGSRNVISATSEWVRYSVTGTVKPNSDFGHRRIILGYSEIGSVSFRKVELSRGTKPMDTGPAVEDTEGKVETLRSEVGTYIRNASENSAELSRRIETVDGKAVDAKTYAQQTAEGFKTRLESLETYKNEEGTRASQYLTASRTETAKQITAERTSIASNYVAKSTYDENVRGTTLKLNEIKSTADTAKQNLATYQNTVDRKLTELTSSTQTLDGKINTASAKVDTVAGQIRTEIGTVEAKIPTEAGGRNYILKSQAEISSTGRWVSKPFNLSSDLLSNLSKIKTVTISCDVEGINVSALNSRKRYGLACSVEINGVVNYWEVWQTQDTTKKRISQTFTVPEGKVITKFHSPTLWIQAAGDIKVSNPKIEFGRVPTDHTLAPEDFANELSSVKTTITQTASGVEQLSTSLATTDNKVTTAEAKIRQLISDVSSKVSQTDYNTLTGRVDDAETAITQNATEISKRLTKTQVDKAITDKGFQTASQVDTAIAGKGYQTKSDVDNNITGRGYITSSALQPYALSTTVQNLVKETAGSFERQITETRGLIPSNAGTRNLLKGTKDLSGNDAKSFNTSDKYLDFNIARSRPTTGYSDTFSAYTTIPVTANDYIISFYAKSDVDGATLYCHFYNPNTTTKAESSTGYKSGSSDGLARVQVTTEWQRYWVKWSQSKTDTVKKVIIGRNNSADGIKIIEVAGVALYEDALNKGHFDAPEDLATVTALHNVNDTVDSHTRTIGAVGTTGSILDNVSKVTQTAAGLVQEVSGTNGLKTQVSTLAGSYAIKSLTKAGDVLGQINLNRDGSIKLDGSLVQITGKTYIQDGVISAAKIGDLDAGKIKTGTLDAARIKANSIDGSKLVFDQAFVNKMTANEALFKQLFAQSAFITSVQAVAVSAKQIAGGIAKALNGGMDVNFDESKINFYTNVAAIRRIYTGHPTQFIKFETEGNYSRTIIGSNRNGGEVFNSATFAGIVVENTNNINTEDNVRIYGDNTLLRHAQGDVGWNINSVTQRIVPANINAESEIWSKHFVAPDKNSKPVRLDTAVAALWDIWNHIIYNNFEFNEALRTHIKARRDNWKFELNL
ncbi:phage tail spike protein [Streptococcus suis]|uniref:phage tail spike protein n=3 Tax=Streptococcus suis TaxID=1307 RepID=UPI000941D51C|nr:phage tail spike protein [Streptococcus suis]